MCKYARHTNLWNGSKTIFFHIPNDQPNFSQIPNERLSRNVGCALALTDPLGSLPALPADRRCISAPSSKPQCHWRSFVCLQNLLFTFLHIFGCSKVGHLVYSTVQMERRGRKGTPRCFLPRRKAAVSRE